MRTRTIWTFAILATAICGIASAATVIHVDASASGGNDGTSWHDAFTDLHDALAAAEVLGGKGVQIWVAAGDYVPGPADADPQLMYTLVSGTAMYGGFAGWETELDQRDWEANETILRRDLPSPGVQQRPIVYGENLVEGSLFDGFIVRDGRSTSGPVPGTGMGLVDSALLIANCHFIDNRASVDGGGAIDGKSVTLTIANCHFIDNLTGTTGFGGGALDLTDSVVEVKDSHFIKNRGGASGAIMAVSSELAVIDCVFHQNSSVFGTSGVRAGGNVTIRGSTFMNNGWGPVSVAGVVHLVDTMLQSNGGAVRVIGSATQATVLRCTFIDNDDFLEGGGLHSSAPSLVVRDSVFRGNRSSFQGGNIYIAAGDVLLVNCEITDGSASRDGGLLVRGTAHVTAINCLFARNSFGGIGVGFVTAGAKLTLINCTIIDNSAGDSSAGLYVEPGNSAAVMNSIFWGNGAPGIESHQIVGAVDVSHSIVQGLDPDGPYAGPGVIGDDPLFIDEDGRLSANSPAVDAGDNAYLPPKIEFDLDGNPRIVDGSGDGLAIVDMGAFEFQPTVLGDLNGDGVVDKTDLLILLAAWGPCPTGGTPVPPSIPPCPADLNGDGVVDVSDLLLLLANWG